MANDRKKREDSNDTEVTRIDLTYIIKFIFLLIGLFPFNFNQLLKYFEIFHYGLDLVVIGTATVVYYLASYLLLFSIGKNKYKKIESDLLSNDSSNSIGSLISTVIITPVAEELVFRLKLLLWLEHNIPLVLAIALSSLAFAFIHINYFKMPIALLDVFIAGVLLGMSFVITGNLLVPIIIHLLRNSVSTYSIYLGRRRVLKGELTP